MNQQTPVDITGTIFPKFKSVKGECPQRFWYIKEEFLRHSREVLKQGGIFSCVHAHCIGGKWYCEYQPTSVKEMSYHINRLRLFYMKTESMSIYSFCSYMEEHVQNKQVQVFFRHMRKSWAEHLESEVDLPCEAYEGPIQTNKQLIDTLLYSGTFHAQEKYKKRYDELLGYLDESLMIKYTYNAFHSSYQMTQISTAIKELREGNCVIMLPNHLSHIWDENCPYSFS